MRSLRINDYEIGFVDGWRDASQAILLAPERPTFTPNIQIHREPVPADDIEEYLRAQRAEISTLDGFSLVEHGDLVLGGIKALHHTYDWILPNTPGTKIRQRQVIAQRNNELFTITMSALVIDWEAASPEFEQALAGFRWY